MKCKIDITAPTDVAAWVARDVFMANVDTDDLACRDSENVLDWYHPGWFWYDDNGDQYFKPPAFEFRNGHLLGINGRHRVVLLCRYLEVIPMLLVRSDMWPEGKLVEIMQQKIERGEVVELPNIPINEAIAEPEEPVDTGIEK